MYLEDQKMYNLEEAEQFLGWWLEEEKLCWWHTEIYLKTDLKEQNIMLLISNK